MNTELGQRVVGADQVPFRILKRLPHLFCRLHTQMLGLEARMPQRAEQQLQIVVDIFDDQGAKRCFHRRITPFCETWVDMLRTELATRSFPSCVSPASGLEPASKVQAAEQ